jgi:adenylate cyclase
VQAVLGARIDRLGAGEKELLQAMSVIGKEIDRAVLREVAGLEATELSSTIFLLAAGEFVVEERTGGRRTLAFKHPLTQEVAYASQLSGPRSDAHAAVASAIERIYPDGLDERAALLAQHREAAGDSLGAARWHTRAAAWVFNSSPAEGLRHWRRVRELAGEVGGGSEAEQFATSARAAILAAGLRLGISHEEAAAIHAEGKGRLTSGAERTYEDVLLDIAYAANVFTGGREQEGFELSRSAASAAEEIDDPGLVLMTSLSHGMAAAVVGVPRECVEVTTRALALAGDDPGAGSRLGIGTPFALCLAIRAAGEEQLGKFDNAFRDLDRSFEVAAASGDPEAEAFALLCRAWAYADLLESERGLRDAERGAELSDHTGSNLALTVTYLQLARLRGECHDFSGALDAAERATAVNDEHGAALAWEPDILCYMAAAQLGLGRGDRARAVAEEAVAVAERRSLKRAVAVSRLGLGRVLLRVEGVAGAEGAKTALAGALAMAGEVGYRALEPQIRLELATLARLGGDRAAAEREEAEAKRLLAEFRALSQLPA